MIGLGIVVALYIAVRPALRYYFPPDSGPLALGKAERPACCVHQVAGVRDLETGCAALWIWD
jgi:hypothetical protein